MREHKYQELIDDGVIEVIDSTIRLTESAWIRMTTISPQVEEKKKPPPTGNARYSKKDDCDD